MFSSRNIHLAILGIILGASAGYVVAFYNAQSSLAAPDLSPDQAQGQMPDNHPDVNNEQMLAAMKKAVETDPSNPAILEALSMYGAALWRMGKKDAASAQLQAALRVDPRHVPSLHGLALLALEKHDAAQADQFIKRIEAIDPAYGQLTDLRNRLQAERGGK